MYICISGFLESKIRKSRKYGMCFTIDKPTSETNTPQQTKKSAIHCTYAQRFCLNDFNKKGGRSALIFC